MGEMGLGLIIKLFYFYCVVVMLGKKERRSGKCGGVYEDCEK